MELEVLRNRVFFLLGQAEEAKRVYDAALGEVNANKKQGNEPSTTGTGNTQVFEQPEDKK